MKIRSVTATWLQGRIAGVDPVIRRLAPGGTGMRIQGVVAGLGVLALSLAGAMAGAQDGNVADGRTLYLDNCGPCHGLMAPKSSGSLPIPAFVRLGSAAPSGPAATVVAAALGARRPLQPRTSEWLAIAPPYGPTLRGVYGRLAGSIANFPYSPEFRRVLQGVVWNGDTLDIWTTNSQVWVPGSLMFYKQPDAGIRRKIIAYLETAR